MDRIDHWPTALMTTVAAAQPRPFDWGVHDCVTFAADCVRAMTGADPLADLPGWASARQALRVIHDLGGMEAALSARLGEPIAPAFAQRGDLGLLHADPAGDDMTGITVAVCMGDVWLAPGTDGLERLPLAAVAKAWKVGR
jgi:hypothetical protein